MLHSSMCSSSQLQVSHLVVLVVDAEPLPQVSEHHGTVLFELKSTRQVFSDGGETESHTVSTTNRRIETH